MNVRRRVEKLEHVRVARCEACGGRGVGAVVTVRHADERGKPRGCATCGRVGAVKRIVLS